MATPSPFDRGPAWDLEPELVAELVELLASEAPRMIAAVADAAAAADAKALRSGAHALKGMLAHFGRAAARAAAEVEALAASGQVEAAAGALPELGREVDRLLEAVQGLQGAAVPGTSIR